MLLMLMLLAFSLGARVGALKREREGVAAGRLGRRQPSVAAVAAARAGGRRHGGDGRGERERAGEGVIRRG